MFLTEKKRHFKPKLYKLDILLFCEEEKKKPFACKSKSFLFRMKKFGSQS